MNTQAFRASQGSNILKKKIVRSSSKCSSSFQNLQFQTLVVSFRAFWCFVILLSFIFCNILVAHFWFRYKSLATRITVATNHAPLSSLKLPALTFCPINHLDLDHSTNFIRKLYALSFKRKQWNHYLSLIWLIFFQQIERKQITGIRRKPSQITPNDK